MQPLRKDRVLPDFRFLSPAMLWALLALFLFLPAQAARAESKEKNSEPAGNEAAAAEKTSAKPESPEKKSGTTVEGLYLGRILKIDPKERYLYLLPEVEGLRKKAFFLDKKTLFRKDRKPFPKKKLAEGQKVAVRFYGEDTLLIAMAVFVVEDEFKLTDYNMPRGK